ncbi:MAG: hypothetical protein CME70_04245 [Halobacteriovorax sp.]|nr:hypothetical protein [Halobacteriovorax sp.]|tara:strand:+ start:59546 stop:60010 length:465 start_codon:yes stop_codon:yes gene_type:complete
MKNLNNWLRDYSVSHKNPTNKKIHNICVPLIMYSILGMMWAIPVPSLFDVSPFLNWASLFIACCMVFYFMLGMVTGVFMLIVGAIMLYACFIVDNFENISIFYSSLVIFILAWVGQFIGHKIEGKKPSFFEDLQFLLVGPLWVFYPMYKGLIRK